jgi:cell division protein FtsL
MAASLARNISDTREIKVRRKTVKRKSALLGSQRASQKMTKIFVVALLISCAFGYIGVNANALVRGYQRNMLTEELRQERIRNQQLKAQWNALSSPDRIVAAAKKNGMVYSTEYEYVSDTKNVIALSQ